MSTIVIGAGEVGLSLAKMLAQEGRDVVVVDRDPEALLRAQEEVDAHTVQGHGAGIRVLEEAGIEEAEMVIAVTDIDEVNMIAAMTAKRLGVAATVARVRNPEYLTGRRIAYKDLLGIDVLIDPAAVAAAKFAAIARSPGAVEIEDYAGGRIRFMHFILDGKFRYLNKKLSDFPPSRDFIIAAIHRRDRLIFPRGSDRLLEDDILFVMAKAEVTPYIRKIFGSKERTARRVAVVGGGRVGFLTAQMLERESIEVRLIERDRALCEELSAQLEKARVIHGEATDVGLLREEKIDHCGLLIAATPDDSENIIISLLAKELGTAKVATLVRSADLAGFVERFGIDVGVSPRLLTANVIFKQLRGGQVISIAKLIDGLGEVLEFAVAPHCRAADRAIRDLDLPKGAIVGAIQKPDAIVIPRGDSVIEAGDHVVMLVLPEVAEEIGRFFRRGA